jgi:hypothetical protein
VAGVREAYGGVAGLDRAAVPVGLEGELVRQGAVGDLPPVRQERRPRGQVG